MKIRRILATSIKNSRGEPTIKINVNNSWGSAPSGASTGRYEAKAYYGTVDSAVKSSNKILKKFIETKFNWFGDLAKIESELPKNFGANPTIAFEFALLNALAKDKGKPLWKVLNPHARKMPRILANVVGGGAHYTKQSLIAGPSRISGSEGKSIDIQEILLSPNTKDIRKDIASTSIFHKELGSLLGASRQTDEGAWVAPDNLTIKDIMEIVFSLSGYESGIDVAASQLYHNGKYHWKNFWGKAKSFSPKQQKEVVENLAEHFGLFYIEDPLQQDDFKGFAELRKKLADVMICGDDLTATNLNRLKKAVKLKAINAIIIKPNQAGSLIKTKEVFDYAVKYNITPIVSHRSGETMDATIAHLAFAWQAPFVKFGISGNERLAKLNELIKIEKKV